MMTKYTAHTAGCNEAFKLFEAQCCSPCYLYVRGPLAFTFRMFATCLMLQLRKQKYRAKCTKTSKVHNLPAHERIMRLSVPFAYMITVFTQSFTAVRTL
eukprot:5430226-Pleurochrysis_carterae.AAC.6